MATKKDGKAGKARSSHSGWSSRKGSDSSASESSADQRRNAREFLQNKVAKAELHGSGSGQPKGTRPASTYSTRERQTPQERDNAKANLGAFFGTPRVTPIMSGNPAAPTSPPTSHQEKRPSPTMNPDVAAGLGVRRAGVASESGSHTSRSSGSSRTGSVRSKGKRPAESVASSKPAEPAKPASVRIKGKGVTHEESDFDAYSSGSDSVGSTVRYPGTRSNRGSFSGSSSESNSSIASTTLGEDSASSDSTSTYHSAPSRRSSSGSTGTFHANAESQGSADDIHATISNLPGIVQDEIERHRKVMNRLHGTMIQQNATMEALQTSVQNLRSDYDDYNNATPEEKNRVRQFVENTEAAAQQYQNLHAEQTAFFNQFPSSYVLVLTRQRWENMNEAEQAALIADYRLREMQAEKIFNEETTRFVDELRAAHAHLEEIVNFNETESTSSRATSQASSQPPAGPSNTRPQSVYYEGVPNQEPIVPPVRPSSPASSRASSVEIPDVPPVRPSSPASSRNSAHSGPAAPATPKVPPPKPPRARAPATRSVTPPLVTTRPATPPPPAARPLTPPPVTTRPATPPPPVTPAAAGPVTPPLVTTRPATPPPPAARPLTPPPVTTRPATPPPPVAPAPGKTAEKLLEDKRAQRNR